MDDNDTRTPPDGGGFAGMPGSDADALRSHITGAPRRGKWFTLPESVMENRSVDAHFLIIELNTDKEDHAARLAGAGFNVAGSLRQMAIASVYGIGKVMKPNYDHVRKWMDAIGPIGRRLVETGFNALNVPENKVTESFLDSGEIWSS